MQPLSGASLLERDPSDSLASENGSYPIARTWLLFCPRVETVSLQGKKTRRTLIRRQTTPLQKMAIFLIICLNLNSQSHKVLGECGVLAAGERSAPPGVHLGSLALHIRASLAQLEEPVSLLLCVFFYYHRSSNPCCVRPMRASNACDVGPFVLLSRSDGEFA